MKTLSIGKNMNLYKNLFQCYQSKNESKNIKSMNKNF